MFTHVFWIKFSLLVFCVICKKVLVTQSKTNIDRDRWVGGAWNCCRWLGKFHPLVRVKVIISLMRHVAWSGRSWMLTVRMRDVSCGKSLNCLTVFTQTSPRPNALCWCIHKPRVLFLFRWICPLEQGHNGNPFDFWHTWLRWGGVCAYDFYN